MKASDNDVSYSAVQNGTSAARVTDIISDGQLQIFTLVNHVFLCGLISLFGIFANVVNLIIFYKQGLNTSINISFFAMAVSDLCSMICELWYATCAIPYFKELRIPMVYSDVQYITGGIPREVFARITCLITAYITAERCLCIAFPLHIKQMLTAKRTTVIIIIIYLVPWLYVSPLFFVSPLDWKFYQDRNKTLFGSVHADNKEAVEGAVYITLAILGVISLLAVVLFTFILIQKLRDKNDWRKTANVHQGKDQSMSKRDRTTITTVVLIASILIISYIPSVMLFVTTFFVPEFSTVGALVNMCVSMWSVAVLFETINSAVNIFLYLKMSSTFRQIFKDLFLRCGRTATNDSR